MPEVIVGKWGKNLAIRLPGEVAKAAGIRLGERLELEADGTDIVLHRAVPRFTLEELFRGRTAEEWRKAYAGAFDWGPDIGGEAVEE